VLDDVHQLPTSYTIRPKCVEFDPNYQLASDRERRMLKPTQGFGYDDLINYTLIEVGEISG